MRSNRDKFHDHLDQCSRCRERPFDLCDTGRALLLLSADHRRKP